MKLNLAVIAFAAVTATASEETTSSLRGAGRELNAQARWSQYLHAPQSGCRGAVCGLWGDPHMQTCDGLDYDCQGIGIFTLMENQDLNIQANFVDVGAHEHNLVRGWGLTHGASITNDVMFHFKNTTLPVVQLGFGDLESFEGAEPIPTSEQDCTPWTTMHPVDFGCNGDCNDPTKDGRRTVETLQSCRARCEANERCTQFSWWADGGCHLNDDNARRHASNRGWPKALVGGNADTCGLPQPVPEIVGSNGEQEKHGTMRHNCPLLFYLDGELQDLSDVAPGRNAAYHPLYGQFGDDLYIELSHHNEVYIYKKMDDGDYLTMELKQVGHGPGELWSCHWDYKVCLPQANQNDYMTTTKGLLGSPDGNGNNDWMTPSGEELPIQKWGHNRHENMINYCVENWCVDQASSLMTYHGDNTYDNYKCEEEEFIDWEEDNERCVLMADQIIMACQDQPPDMKYGCQLDCCLGGCDMLPPPTPTLPPIQLETEDKDIVVYDYKDDECETLKDFRDTGDSKCPGADIVKLLRTKGDEPLPEDTDILYDIAFGAGTVSFKVNNPFKANAEAFVAHEKKALEGFLDPTCDAASLTPSPCMDDFSVEVACLDYDDVEPFALVSVYFASVAVSPLNEQAVIQKCCDAEEYAPAVGIVEYTFEIKCGCPTTLG